MFKIDLKSLILSTLLIVGCGPKINIDNYVEDHCLATQSQCVVINEIGHFSILFNVDKVRTDIPFKLIIRYDTPNENIKLSGYLEGKDMFMGKIPMMFSELPQKNKFVVETMLAACSEERMTWRLWLTVNAINAIDNSKQNTTFFIDFDSIRL